MYLLHSVLQRATGITHMAAGCFTGPEHVHEVAVVKGSSCIDILRVVHGPLGTKLLRVAMVDTFSVVRSVGAVRLPGDATDMLAIASDSGCFVLARVREASLERLFIHPYAKAGCQRTSPGHFLKVDPLGRAVLLGAIEHSKVVYVLEREGVESEDLGKMRVRSPLEANRPGQLTLAVEFLANTRANPRFVALEKEPAGVKTVLVVYEVEVGLNHIARIASLDVSPDAYDIMALPSGHFMVFGEASTAVYACLGVNRVELVETVDSLGLVASHCSMKWIQTEPGELYVVDAGKWTLLSSMPPAKCIAVLGDAYLLSASVSSSHRLYQITAPPSLQLLEELPNLAPILSSSVQRTRSGRKEDAISLFVSTGYHRHSPAFACIKPGLAVHNIATSGLPECPVAVFKASADLYAICFPTRSTFLRVGESIEEDTTVPFDCRLSYLWVSELEGGAGTIAVHSGGWRQAGGERVAADVEWRAGAAIVGACANARQLAVALADDLLLYFELTSSGQMREAGSVKLPAPTNCMAFAAVPAGRQRSRFLVIGGQDSVVRLLSCDPDDRMAQLALQAAAQPPTSLMFTSSSGQLMLHVGLKSGVYVRLTVDRTSGAISDPQSRYLGPAAVRFFPCSPPGHLIALSSKPWMVYSSHTHNHDALMMAMAPLSISSDFTLFAPFHTDNIPNALMAVSRDAAFSVLLVSDYDLSLASIHSSIPAAYTPRKHEYVEPLGLFVTVESAPQGQGRVSVVSEDLTQVLASLDMACFVHSALMTRFGEGAEWYLLVGTSEHFDVHTRASNGSSICAFHFDPDSRLLTELHKTDCPRPPHVMVPFIGKVLVGCDEAIRMYELGKKRMLRKCQVKVPSSVHFLDSQGCRIYAGTSLQSLMMFVYRARENQLQCFADDIVSRPLSAMAVLDYETVLIADRMGCLSVLRVPAGLSEAMEKDPAGLTSAVRETLFAAPHKLERVCEFTVGEVVTGLCKCSLFLGARQSVLYTTIHGTIGNLAPIQFRSTSTFLQSLESELRGVMHPTDSFPLCSLTGRHQLLRRSHLGQTVKGVIDGAFLGEAFAGLPADLKLKVASALDKDPSEIARLVRDHVCVF